MKRTGIGIFGAGQLGRMLSLAGASLGLEMHLYDTGEDPCGADVADFTLGTFDNKQAVLDFASVRKIVTAEFENIPLPVLSWASEVAPVFPTPNAFMVAQDRLKEKELATKLGVAVPPYRSVQTLDELKDAFQALGSKKSLLKSRTQGYDGKGQSIIEAEEDFEDAWSVVNGKPSLLEEYFSYDREISIVAVRGLEGQIEFYDIAVNTHKQGILISSVVTGEKHVQANKIAEQILEELNYVGVIAIEFFEKAGKLYFNEFAPRVHNTGHWTIEGAETSQFENHLRAISGLPLGSTETRSPSVMLNILGSVPDIERLLRIKNSHLHLYGKQERPGRKIGHLTLVNPHPGDRLEAEKIVIPIL